MKPELMWASAGKAGNGEPFLSVYKLDHYYYAQRPGIDSVAFILTNDHNQVGLIDIYHGPTPDVRICAFTGSMDMTGKDYIETVIAEVKEESGYIVGPKDITYIRKFEVGTQTNEMVHLFLVKVSETNKGDREPDGPHEAASRVVWMDPVDAMQSRDWKAVLLSNQFILRRALCTLKRISL